MWQQIKLFALSGLRALPFPVVADIQENAQQETEQKKNQRALLYQLNGKAQPRDFIQQEVNIRSTLIVVSQLFPHLPVPVGAQAIAPSIPDAENKPGKGGER